MNFFNRKREANMDVAKDVGNYLLKFRTLYGMSQYDIADILNTNQTRVSLVERGMSAMRPDELLALATKFGHQIVVRY